MHCRKYFQTNSILCHFRLGNYSDQIRRFNAIREINTVFSFLWHYSERTEAELQEQCKLFSQKYQSDVSAIIDIFVEILHLKNIHVSNFEKLTFLTLLDKLASFKLDVFCNIVTALRIFCTIDVTVASAERSFSKLARIKNFQRITMLQRRLTDLGTLSIERDLAREVNSNITLISIISSFRHIWDEVKFTTQINI